MRLLVDGDVLLRWLQGSDDLSAEAVAALRRRTNEVFVSVATLWELAVKQSLGQLKVDVDLREHLREQGFEELPVVGEHAEAVRSLPPHDGDPFDRMLVAQARCEGLTLVTGDRALAAYDVPVLPALAALPG